MPHIKTKKKDPLGRRVAAVAVNPNAIQTPKRPCERYITMCKMVFCAYVVCMNVRMRAMLSGSVYTSHPDVGLVFRLMGSGVLEMLTFGISVFVKSFAEN